MSGRRNLGDDCFGLKNEFSVLPDFRFSCRFSWQRFEEVSLIVCSTKILVGLFVVLVGDRSTGSLGFSHVSASGMYHWMADSWAGRKWSLVYIICGNLSHPPLPFARGASDKDAQVSTWFTHQHYKRRRISPRRMIPLRASIAFHHHTAVVFSSADAVEIVLILALRRRSTHRWRRRPTDCW